MAKISESLIIGIDFSENGDNGLNVNGLYIPDTSDNVKR